MTASDFAMLRAELHDDEGLRLKPYRCSAGKLTIGYGRNLEDVGISKEVAEFMLTEDIDACYADLLSFAWFSGLDPGRQRALLNLRFQLGPGRFRGFKKMLAALGAKDYDAAAYEAMNSLWWTQTQKSRRERVYRLLKHGKK